MQYLKQKLEMYPQINFFRAEFSPVWYSQSDHNYKVTVFCGNLKQFRRLFVKHNKNI